MYSPKYSNQSKKMWRNLGAKSVSIWKISDINIELTIINILILILKIVNQLVWLRKCELHYHNFGIQNKIINNWWNKINYERIKTSTHVIHVCVPVQQFQEILQKG